MKYALIVGIGSFFGGIIRYIVSMFVQTKTLTSFPFGTLAVNLAGCFIIGCLFGLSEKWQLSYEWRLLLTTGFLGGFTTFSAFSVETHYLLKTGQTTLGLIYILVSLVLGIAFTFLGAWLFRFDPAQL
jgi:fluoride exporter